MRAVVRRSSRLVACDVPDPVPAPGMALVRTLACGICGSDLHALEHLDRMVEAASRSGSPFLVDPSRDVVMGHEFAAEVLDYAEGSSRPLPVGTRVCAMPLTVSAAGLSTVGYSNDFPGGYGERMLLQEMLLLPIPNGLATHHAALTEPMAVGLHAVEAAAMTPGDVPLVVGCGPIGLAVVAALKLRGSSPIVAADFSPARRALALRMGADVVVDPAAESPWTRWQDLANPHGVDPNDAMTLIGLGPQLRPGVVFECVGVPGVIAGILEKAMRHTRIVVVGVCMERDHFEPILAINKELSLRFVLGYTPEEFAATLAHLAEGRIDVSPLVTGRVGLDGVAAAFEELKSPDRHAKVIVEPWEVPMSKVVSLRRPLPWNALALVPAAALSAFLLANVAGCGSGDCVIITTGTKDEYTVEIVVTSDGELGALQLEVTTDDCNGEWEGRGDQVECVALVEAITAANFAGQDALKVGLISLEGIETPAAVLRCTYRSFQAPEPSDFRVEVLDAADTESQPLAPVPVVAIGAIILVDD